MSLRFFNAPTDRGLTVGRLDAENGSGLKDNQIFDSLDERSDLNPALGAPTRT